MRILFAGNKERGLLCLDALLQAGHTIVGIILNPGNITNNLIGLSYLKKNIPIFQPDNINDPDNLKCWVDSEPDIIVLAGFSQKVHNEFFSIAKYGCLNLHGGKLPQYRGSSPMNWALIRGEKEFSITIIKVDEGIDTGDILAQKTFPIGPNDTIKDLQDVANREFPTLLLEVIHKIENGLINPIVQASKESAYFPLRFPSDGLIIWDLFTAEEIHNRIRALTEPYTGAFTFYSGKKIQLYHSFLTDTPFYGEPGRIYRISPEGFLICALDQCIWISKAVVIPDGTPIYGYIKRYDKMITIRDCVLDTLMKK